MKLMIPSVESCGTLRINVLFIYIYDKICLKFGTFRCEHCAFWAQNFFLQKYLCGFRHKYSSYAHSNKLLKFWNLITRLFSFNFDFEKESWLRKNRKKVFVFLRLKRPMKQLLGVVLWNLREKVVHLLQGPSKNILTR